MPKAEVYVSLQCGFDKRRVTRLVLDFVSEMADFEGARPRIASSQLAQYIGKPVCFVGRVEKVRGAGEGGCGGVANF